MHSKGTGYMLADTSEGYCIYHLGWVLGRHAAKAQDIYQLTHSEGYWIYHQRQVLG